MGEKKQNEKLRDSLLKAPSIAHSFNSSEIKIEDVEHLTEIFSKNNILPSLPSDHHLIIKVIEIIWENRDKLADTSDKNKILSDLMEYKDLLQRTQAISDLMEYKDLLQRTQANFENYRKQTEKRMEEIKQMASREMIMQVLPVIDNFELALKNFSQNHNSKDFAEGVELIYSQLWGILKNSGVEIIPSEGKQFDPYCHEALIKEDSSKPENEIIEEFQKGFTLCGKVIRQAKVKISAGKYDANSKEKNNLKDKK